MGRHTRPTTVRAPFPNISPVRAVRVTRRRGIASVETVRIMKKTIALLAFAAMSAMAANWTGYIVDQACAGKKKDDHGASLDHASCAARCIKGGSPAVF